MKIFFRLFDIFTYRQLRYCCLIFFSMILGGALEALGIGAVWPLIQLIGTTNFLEHHPVITSFFYNIGINEHGKLVMFFSFLLILVYIAKNAYMVWQLNLQIKFSTKNQIWYSKELLENYLSKPYEFFLTHNTALLIRNVGNIGNVIFQGMLLPAFMLLTEFIAALSIWIFILVMDAFTAVIVAGFMGGAVYFITRKLRKKISHQGEIQNRCNVLYLKWLHQALGGIKEAKVMRKEEYFLSSFSNAYASYSSAFGKFFFINQMPKFVIELLVIVSLLSLIIIKIMAGDRPNDIVALLGILSLSAFRLMPSANRIIGLYNTIKYQQPFFDEVYEELLNIKNRHGDAGIMPDRSMSQEITFDECIAVDGVEFKYAGSEKIVLSEVSFHIKKGDFVGIIGASGAGKTTLVDIILGLLIPTKGCVKVDGCNIHKNITSWQSKIAYVPQEIYLIDGSLKENIALGVPVDEIDYKLLNRCIEMAELRNLVDNLEYGLDTNVGERGVKLSGGQKQRIGIARACYQNPEILILDEATSALDNATEKAIMDTIVKLKRSITIIAIAHRLSTLEKCDYKITL